MSSEQVLESVGNRMLTGKVVVVAGVGPGLGRALALRSALAGADVVLAARTESRLHEVAQEVSELGRKAVPVAADITDEDDLANLADRAFAEFGRVDGVVGAAFKRPRQKKLLETNAAEIREFTDVNVLAAVQLVQQLAPALIESRGSVVLINSMIIHNRLPNFGTYRMNKAGLLAAARSLSVELGPQGVRVNSVAPGYIWADQLRVYFQWMADQREVSLQQVYDEIAGGMDLRKLPEPDEIADSAVFLLSDMARAITGQCIHVNCGESHH